MMSIGIIILSLLSLLLVFSIFRFEKKIGAMLLFALGRGIAQIIFLTFLLWLIEKWQNTLTTFLFTTFMLLWASVEGGIRLWLRSKPMEKSHSISLGSFILIQFTAFFSMLMTIMPIYYFFIFSTPMNQSYFWLAINGQLLLSGLFLSISSGKFFIDNSLNKQEKIETALGLGLSIKNSFHWLIVESLRHSLMPHLFVATLLGSGNVPALMSGLLMAKISIEQAFLWQISVILGTIVSGLSVSQITLYLLYRLFSHSRFAHLSSTSKKK